MAKIMAIDIGGRDAALFASGAMDAGAGDATKHPTTRIISMMPIAVLMIAVRELPIRSPIQWIAVKTARTRTAAARGKAVTGCQRAPKNATAVMTNVPGPQQALYFAGARIDRLMFWVPQSGDIGMGVSILSYDGAVQFGLITDRGLCPDPENVIAHFAPEFEKLVLTTLMAPWPWEGDLDPALAAMVLAPSLVAADR